jgi:hypothetical protein
LHFRSVGGSIALPVPRLAWIRGLPLRARRIGFMVVAADYRAAEAGFAVNPRHDP